MSNSEERPFRILGIDPGTATVGYGVIDVIGSDRFRYERSGIIQTSKHLPPGQRLAIIREDLLTIINDCHPDACGVEAIFFFKNAKTLVPVAQARGVILEACHSAGVQAYEYTPMQVKQTLTGHGRAEKWEVQKLIANVLGLTEIIKPDDAADALAIALCVARLGGINRNLVAVS